MKLKSMISSKNLKIAGYHLAGWTLHIAFEIYVASLEDKVRSWYLYVIFYGINAGFFYTFLYVLFRKKNWNHIVFLALIVIVGFTCIYVSADHLTSLIRDGGTNSLRRKEFIRGFWRESNYIIVSLVVFFAYKITELRGILKVQQLEEANKQLLADYNLLKAEMALSHSRQSQHLIANTLSFVYNKVDEESPEAGNAITYSNKIIAYGISLPAADGKVPLVNELQNVEHLIALQKVINEQQIYIDYQKDVDSKEEDARILPYLVYTFVENIFKHGDLEDPSRPATVHLTCKDHLLTLTIRNRISNSGQQGHGIGLENQHIRLNQYYQKADYSMEVSTNELFYALTFKIKL